MPMALQEKNLKQIPEVFKNAFKTSRLEKYNPRNVLQKIREYVPLPVLFSVLGLAGGFLVANIFQASTNSRILYTAAGFAAGFITGVIADSYAGPEKWEPKS